MEPADSLRHRPPFDRLTPDTSIPIVGFGAAVLLPGLTEGGVGREVIKHFDKGGNMAAPLLAEHLGVKASLGFLAAVAFATMRAVVARLRLPGASALSHDIYDSVIRKGEATEPQQVAVARVAREGRRGEVRGREAAYLSRHRRRVTPGRRPSMKRVLASGVVIVALTIGLAVTPARAQWTLTGADGQSSLTLGFLAQAQAESFKPVGSSDFQHNLFMRRVRIIGGGRVNARTSFFFDTDVPGLGKGQLNGRKVENTMILQDFALTQTLCSSFKVDAGMLLVPLSHNSQQSGGMLLPVDYGPYSFLSSDTLNAKIGRDYGVQARAFLVRRRIELRAGVFQGNRGTDMSVPMRVTARGVLYPFEADTGLFYTGTTLGKRKILALGGSVDAQRNYTTWSSDVFLDWPLAGDGFTLQTGFMRYDGGSTFASLPRQDCVLVEAGYYLHTLHVSPFVQYASRNFKDPLRTDETRWQGGFAVWGNGHRQNLKLALAQLTREHVSDGIQFVAQWQVMAF